MTTLTFGALGRVRGSARLRELLWKLPGGGGRQPSSAKGELRLPVDAPFSLACPPIGVHLLWFSSVHLPHL